MCTVCTHNSSASSDFGTVRKLTAKSHKNLHSFRPTVRKLAVGWKAGYSSQFSQHLDQATVNSVYQEQQEIHILSSDVYIQYNANVDRNSR